MVMQKYKVAELGTPYKEPSMSASDIWKSIEAMALNPDVDAAKIGALLGYQERIMDRAAKDAFFRAKNNCMMEMPKITRDSSIIHPGRNGSPDRLIGRYRKYEDLRKVIDPVLDQNHLRITHDTGYSGTMKMPTVCAILSFAADGMTWTERGGNMVIPMDTTGAKSPAQSSGSSLSYGMRYTTCAMLGIVIENEDKDGNSSDMVLLGGEMSEAQMDDAETAARDGIEEYQKFFHSLDKIQKAWLSSSGEHKRLKGLAAEAAI